MMAHNYKIMLDLDGVLAAFGKKAAQLMGLTLMEGMDIADHPNFDKTHMWNSIKEYDSHTPFFYSLEVMEDSWRLWDFVIGHFNHDDISFLTASGDVPEDAPAQKRRWVKKNYGNFKVEIVNKSKDKAFFAGPNIILIDDRSKSIDPWIEAGGIGILHKDVSTTIHKLKELLENKYE